MPRLVAVVGGKHSGKTTVVEHLLSELKRRGYRVGAIKEMMRIPRLDTPGKETDRYSQAGAETVIAVPRDETVVFIKRRLAIKEILPFLTGLDFAVLEGFESEKGLPTIVAAKTVEEAEGYLDCFVIAVTGIITNSPLETQKARTLNIPLLNSDKEIRKLADLVEQNATS